MELNNDDLRAATAAGIIDEAQAARLSVLVHQRAGRLAKGLPEDEPFELFQGFAEIFISTGLILLVAGIAALSVVLKSFAASVFGLTALCWVLSLYFTQKRRMSLPSIVLASGFGIGIASAISWLFITLDISGNSAWVLAVGGGLCILAMLLHYRFFHVPFSMFIAGLFGLAAIIGLMGMITPDPMVDYNSWQSLFDLRQGGQLATATLAFGVCALIAGLWFDLQDPHRVGRMARSAFWLHLLAAPALVNTIMMTAYNIDGSTGMALTIVGLLVVTLFALIIDRRSFLTAGLGYLAAVIIWAFQIEGEGVSIPILMLVLGSIVTVLGTYWIALRNRLMRALPNFPGKTRLPPYVDT